MNQILIMAEGAGTRWRETQTRYKSMLGWIPASMHKQMIKIGDEPIILRMIRMVRELGEFEILSVAHDDLANNIRPLTKIYTQGYICSLVEGIMNTRPYWSVDGRTILLLGDVIFSYPALQAILDYQGSVGFLGRRGPNQITGKAASELFALSIEHDLYETIFDSCAILKKSEREEKRGMRLWDLLDHLNRNHDCELLTLPGDYTDDMDSPEEYLEFFLKLDIAALNEARKPQGATGTVLIENRCSDT